MFQRAQAIGTYLFWDIRQRYKLGTKTMFNTIAIAILLLNNWGMIGIWTDKFEFHHVWEVWVSHSIESEIYDSSARGSNTLV
jgi:hypothetical protein